MMHLNATATATAPTQSSPSYADKINSQFSKNASHYVDILTRVASAIKQDPFVKVEIDAAIASFKANNPNIKWKDLKLPKAQIANLSQILIDDTLQRWPDVKHYCRIIKEFKALRVMPICVYQDPEIQDKYVAFEGQHTSIALFLIALLAMGHTPEECQVPIVIYDTTEKPEIRKNFIGWATDDRKPLDQIDLYQQMVYGVRTDNTTNDPAWNIIEKKQQALEQNGIFATDAKFNNAHLPGAFSRMTELMDNKNYSLAVTQHFAKYFKYVCNSSRPVQPKESWIMYKFFKYCEECNINVDDTYIQQIAESVKLAFKDSRQNFILLQDAARESYQTWYRRRPGLGDGTLLGIRYPEEAMVMTFFLKQVEKNFKGTSPVPQLVTPLWPVPAKDLL